MKKIIYYLVSLAILFFAHVVSVAAQDTSSLLTVGSDAPSFTLKTVNEEPVSLSDFRGKYVVLDFWASWCPDCRKLNPMMFNLFNKYKDKNVAFLGVSFDIDKKVLADYLYKSHISWPQVSEFKKWKETEISVKYGIKWIPTVYVVSPDGKVLFTCLDGNGLAEKLDVLLK